MIIFLYGDDTHRSRAHLKKMIERFRIERDPQGCNVDIIDCESAQSTDVMSRACAVPFLAERRMVIVESLISKGSDDLVESFIDRISAGTLPEENVFVFWEPSGKFKKKKLPDLLKKEKFVQEFAHLQGAQLAQWVSEEAKERGAELEPGVAQKIADYCVDSWEAKHLVNQLAGFVWSENRPVTLKDLDIFTEEKIDDNIFALVDAIGNRNKKQAFKLLQEQWRQGVNDHYLFSMLARQFRIVASVSAAKMENERATSNEIAKILGQHPFVVKKTMALLPRYSAKDISFLYNELVDMDTAVKTGRGEMRVLMSSFVSRL